MRIRLFDLWVNWILVEAVPGLNSEVKSLQIAIREARRRKRNRRALFTLPQHAAAVPQPTTEVATMIRWAVTLLVIALIAGLLGFGVVAGVAVEAAKTVFFVAIVLFAISVIAGLVRGRTVPRYLRRLDEQVKSSVRPVAQGFFF